MADNHGNGGVSAQTDELGSTLMGEALDRLAAGEDFLVQGALKRINLRVIDQPLVEETQNLHVVIIVAGRVPC